MFDLVCTIADKTKAQTFVIRSLGSPQAIIILRESPRRMARTHGLLSKARSCVEVVIQTAIELICKLQYSKEYYTANLQLFSDLAMK